MKAAYLLTGGNLGDRDRNLSRAREMIENCCGRIVQASPIYRTAAWGVEDQPDFYNQALEVATPLSPDVLMKELLAIEEKMGRTRTVKMGPRIIDIDILLYGDEIIHRSGLTIPHERLHLRRFALVPLAAIAPDVIHPGLQKSIRQLLKECPDPLDVHKIH